MSHKKYPAQLRYCVSRIWMLISLENCLANERSRKWLGTDRRSSGLSCFVADGKHQNLFSPPIY